MPVAVLFLHLSLPGCLSLKDKRGRIKPLLARLHREFNGSTVEYDRLDAWNEAVVACAVISNDAVQCRRVLQSVTEYTSLNFRDVEVLDQQIEILS